MTVLSDDRQPMFHTIFTAHPLPVRRALGLLRQRFASLTEPDALSRLELALTEVLDSICTRITDRATVHRCVIRGIKGISCAVTDDGPALGPSCLGTRELPKGSLDWTGLQQLRSIHTGRRYYLGFTMPLDHSLSDLPPPMQ